GKTSRPSPEVQRAHPRMKDAGTWNIPYAACACRGERENLVADIDRVEADRVEVTARAAANHRLAVGGRRPSQSNRRRKVSFLSNRGMQAVRAQNRRQEFGLGEIGIEAIRLVRPGQTIVHGQARVDAPGVSGIEAVEVHHARLAKVTLERQARADVSREAMQRKPQNVV